MSGHDGEEKSGGGCPPPARERNAERFERQARALRENLRRRSQQRRAGERTPREEDED